MFKQGQARYSVFFSRGVHGNADADMLECKARGSTLGMAIERCSRAPAPAAV